MTQSGLDSSERNKDERRKTCFISQIIPIEKRRGGGGGRARTADAAYNNTPKGVIGPIEAMLATMPQVECFSVGAFGEVNRAVATFLNALADKGSDVPERFGCCHGKEQAKGVTAQFLRRRLGRTLLRGAVRFRHVALRAISGTEEQEPGEAQATTGHLGDEWCASSRPWVPCH